MVMMIIMWYRHSVFAEIVGTAVQRSYRGCEGALCSEERGLGYEVKEWKSPVFSSYLRIDFAMLYCELHIVMTSVVLLC